MPRSFPFMASLPGCSFGKKCDENSSIVVNTLLFAGFWGERLRDLSFRFIVALPQPLIGFAKVVCHKVRIKLSLKIMLSFDPDEAVTTGNYGHIYWAADGLGLSCHVPFDYR